MNISIIPLASSIISFFFALTVLDQFFARRRAYQLVWAMGLFMYFISTGAEFWVEVGGLNDFAYRLWYLFGAILVAAYLGMGTVYLLVNRRAAHVIMVGLAIVSLYAAFRVFTVSVDLGSLTYLSGKILPENVRNLSRYLSFAGTVPLLVGPLYSAFVFWRRRFMPHRVLSNTLIFIGAMLPAIGGPIFRAGGQPLPAYLLELVGIIIIFTGFLRSHEVFGLYRFPLIHGFRQLPR